MKFNFTGTSLELCSRPGCCHYRGEHAKQLISEVPGQCNGLGRGPDSFMIPGTRCECPEFVSGAHRSLAE